jgi:hypothetical protein
MWRTNDADGVVEKFRKCSVKLRLHLPLNGWSVHSANASPPTSTVTHSLATIRDFITHLLVE